MYLSVNKPWCITLGMHEDGGWGLSTGLILEMYENISINVV